MSFIKSRSVQASNYSSITCIVCSIKLPCSAEHWRAANAVTEQVRRKLFCRVGQWKKFPLTLQPVCTDEWGLEFGVWGCQKCKCDRKSVDVTGRSSPPHPSTPALLGRKLRGCAGGLGEVPLKVCINSHHFLWVNLQKLLHFQAFLDQASQLGSWSLLYSNPMSVA